MKFSLFLWTSSELRRAHPGALLPQPPPQREKGLLTSILSASTETSVDTDAVQHFLDRLVECAPVVLESPIVAAFLELRDHLDTRV